jgi:hypothetical protein
MVMDTVPPPSLRRHRGQIAHAAERAALQRQWAAGLIKAPPKPPSRPLWSRESVNWALLALPWIVLIVLSMWQDVALLSWGRAFITGDGF